MKRTVTALADGRELIYFDESDDAVRDAVDSRQLPAPPAASQLRHDPVTDEWIAVTTHRQTRTFLPPAGACPLCPSTAEFASEIPASSYDVVAFENRFPAFSQRTEHGVGTRSVRPGRGRCEVVSFTSDHHASFASLPASRVRTIVEAWADRTYELSALPGVEQVYCFENRGEAIGVTLHHPHGQIYAYPYVAPRTRQALSSAEAYAARTGGANLFADLLAEERTCAQRVVAGNEHWTAFVPFAARWPYEVHLYPHRQVPDIPALTEAERDGLVDVYPRLLRAFDALFDAPMPYIAAWHQAPVRDRRDLGYLHLELFSIQRDAAKLKYLAGSEAGMDAFLNDVLPEQAAADLRERMA